MASFPLQPLYTDSYGVVRFRANRVVTYLLEKGGLDVNMLARVLPDSPDDWEQFAQLIGYSLSGFGELPYVRDETYETAARMAEQHTPTEQEARTAYLEELVTILRGHVREMAVCLFQVTPEDLVE